MDMLIFAQTLFFFTVSFAIILIGLFCGIVAYKFISIVKHLENVSKDIDNTSLEVSNRIKELFESLESFPFLSYFLKNKIKKSEKKIVRKRYVVRQTNEDL